MGKFGKKFSLDAESPVVQASEQILTQPSAEQGRVEQPSPQPVKNEAQNMGAPAVAPMMTKGISVKLPYDIYDHLDAKKKMSQRTGNRADRKTLEEIIIDYLREGMENHPL